MRSPDHPKPMLPTTAPTDRTTIPTTGLGSILVAVCRLDLVADRGVVAERAVAVGMGEGSFSDRDRRPWVDATVAAPTPDLVGERPAGRSAEPEPTR